MFLIDQGSVYQISKEELNVLLDDPRYRELRQEVSDLTDEIHNRLANDCFSEDEYLIRFGRETSEGECLRVQLELVRAIWKNIKDENGIDDLNKKYLVKISYEEATEKAMNEFGGGYDLDMGLVMKSPSVEESEEKALEFYDKAKREGIDPHDYITQKIQNLDDEILKEILDKVDANIESDEDTYLIITENGAKPMSKEEFEEFIGGGDAKVIYDSMDQPKSMVTNRNPDLESITETEEDLEMLERLKSIPASKMGSA